MKLTLTITGTLIRKDVLSLLPLVLLAALVQVVDLLVEKLDILPVLAPFMPYVVWLAGFALILSVFQLDAPASLVDDWLCRPIPKGALLTAKLSLIFATLYGSRALATLAIDLYLGYTLPESLLEALLWQEGTVFFVFPIFIMIAVVTSTLVQGMGALLGLFLVIFMIPTPLISPPSPLEPGIGDAIGEVGLGWMTTAPAKFALMATLGLCLHTVFRHRNILLGRILLVMGTAATVLLACLPMWLVPWTPVYEAQLSVSGRAEDEVPAAAETFTLHAEGACFPALTLDALSSDATYAAASRAMGVAPWTERQLTVAGTGGISFITRVAPRGLPRDWRAKAAYVQATYSDGEGGSIELRPASYVSDRNNASSQAYTHQWLLPQADLERLQASARPRLELSYSIVLLRPETFELAADGIRHRLPGLGWCGATLEQFSNRIVVDCFSASPRPALVSAELLDIEASRVDATPPDYAPALIQLPTSRRVEMMLPSPSLLREPVVKVTAWHDAGMLQSSVLRDGILGDGLDACPLPSSNPSSSPQMSNWSDDSSHRVSYITVDENVQLEVLDWGGTGTPLLLLPGLGATAHTWDAMAPKLTRDFHVIALSRRGVGGSSRPESGYDTATLARDVVRVLDAFDMDQAVIVGSSIAGEEMTWLGAEYPDRAAALIYLDAAYDHSREQPEDLPMYDELLPPGPPIRPEELRSYKSLLQWFERTDTDPMPEGELIAAYNFSNRYLAGAPSFDMRLLQAIGAAIEEPRYRDIKVPALALYATKVRWEDEIKPWYDRNDDAVMNAVRGSFEFNSKEQRRAIEQFQAEAPGAKVIEFPGASHVIFISHEAEVIAEIRRFVAEKVQGAVNVTGSQ